MRGGFLLHLIYEVPNTYIFIVAPDGCGYGRGGQGQR